MAEATSSTSGSSSTTSSGTTKPAPKAQQVILPSTYDNVLQPDAMRGSEHVTKPLKEDGTLIDEEDERKPKDK